MRPFSESLGHRWGIYFFLGLLLPLLLCLICFLFFPKALMIVACASIILANFTGYAEALEALEEK